MGGDSDSVVFEGAKFSTSVTSAATSKTLVLLGNGIYDTEIHYLQIKFYGIGVYAESEIGSYLKEWAGKSEEELLDEDSGFFPSVCKAPVEKLVKLVIIKEVKGSQFVTPLQASVRDRLAYADLFEDEEEEALDSLVELFQKKTWLSQGSVIFLHWPSSSCVQVSVTGNSDEDFPTASELSIRNENVAKGIQDWLLGPNSLSPSLLKSVAAAVVTRSS